MKRTVELEDSLSDCAELAIEELKEYYLEYLKENTPDETPCLSNDLDYDGRFHEIVDICVPIYTYEIETAWFLHSNELEEAYENAGVGDNPRENNGTTAIYFYISEKCYEWWSENAKSIFEEWEEKQEATEPA